MNKELLLKIKEKILAEPRQFIMNSWFSEKRDRFNDPESIPNCGTAACIAGWALTIDKNLNPRETAKVWANNDPFTINWKSYDNDGIINNAANLLGINQSEADLLFQVEYWPWNYQSEWRSKLTAAERAAIAARLIDEIIERDGIFWNEEDSEHPDVRDGGY